MAFLEHSLVMVLSGLLVASSYGFPSLRLLFQDGLAGNHIKPRSPHRASLLAAAGQWEWMTAGEASHGSPLLPRRKRETVVRTKRSTDHTNSTTVMNTVPLHGQTTAVTLSEEFTETTDTQPSTSPLYAMGRTKQTSTASSQTLMNAGSLHGQTTAVTLSEEFTETTDTQPSTSPPYAMGRTKQTSTASSQTLMNAGSLHGQTTPVPLSEEFTETEDTQPSSPPPYAMGTTEPTSTTSAQTLPATLAISVATSGLDSNHGVNKGSTNSSSSPPMANPKPSPTVQTISPPEVDSRGPNKMLKQCLLAISLLALVAGIFIITTFVLAAMLWRQKRAYKLSRRNPTEMVCISSLLAAEEAETSGERLSRVKRVKMLPENGSEVDMDNLTLNSFLPDH